MSPPNLDVWVLAGQSNMQGYGMLAGALPPDSRVWNFSMGGKWELAQEPLHRIWESCTPVHIRLNRRMYGVSESIPATECAAHENRVRIGGAGLGLSFGQTLATLTSKPVGLISTAFGGTSLEDWSPGQKHLGGESLYGAMLERVERAGGHLRGILWYQGESDCTPEYAPTYAARLDDFIAAIRRDTAMPLLPFIAVQIGRSITGQFHEFSQEMDIVRDALGKLPVRVTATAVTSAVDLSLIDGIHIDTPSLIRLGKRMGRLAHSLMDNGQKPFSPTITTITKASAPFGSAILKVTCAGLSGGWSPQNAIPGFSIHLPDGTPHPSIFVVNASVNADDPFVIDLLLNAPIQEPLSLAYGLGRSPLCRLVDQADMPLCTFCPRPI